MLKEMCTPLSQLTEEDITDLRVLRMAVTSYIQASFDHAALLGDEVISAQREVELAFEGSSMGLDAFTRA